MLAIYYCVIIVVGLLISPVLLFKKRARAGFSQKLGFVPEQVFTGDGERPLWFHSVSVGEFNALWPLLRELHEKYPSLPLAVSTTTETGHNLARERAGSFARVFYFPYDLPWSASNWLTAINPAAVLIVETEVWPGFYQQCRQRNIALLIVNGRMSPRSYSRYKRLSWLFSRVFGCAAQILAQSDEEAGRYRDITGSGVPITVTGNLKFDGFKPMPPAEQEALRAQLGIGNQLVLIGGSTHESEEEPLLKAARELKEKGIDARLILVPRHPERFARVAELIESYGFRARRFSRQETFADGRDVYLLDAIGHLMRFYSVADVAFVGGTIITLGGHNVAEPYTYSVPVVSGPHVQKTRDSARALESLGAMLIARDAQHVTESIVQLSGNPAQRKQMGESGKRWVEQSQGAVNRTLALIEKTGVIADSAKLAEAKR
ncbi:MAG TPA: 3-deoxy-D-manno-octulosonic acid transferase [Planktothrix sp.]